MKDLTIVEHDGQLVTDSREVAEMVGKRHTDLLRSIDGYIEILLNAKLRSVDFFIESKYKDSTGKENKCYLLTRKGCDMVANKMTGEKGVLFTAAYVTRFEQMENRIKQEPFQSTPGIEKFEMHLIGMKYTAEILRVDEPSKIRMLTDVHKAHGVPTNHLPQYVQDELKKSLTELLKAHNVPLTAAKANTKLLELGLLEIKQRPSSNGSMREFKSLTEAGRQYGDNAISPRNAKETQPLYYPSKFNDLLKILL